MAKSHAFDLFVLRCLGRNAQDLLVETMVLLWVHIVIVFAACLLTGD
jgi:hypothetical protein